MGNRVIIIGGGVAGMQAAITLDELGLQPVLIEKEAILGGKLNKWDRLFPTMTPASEVLTELTEKLRATKTEVHTSTAVGSIDEEGNGVTLADGKKIAGDAVIVASGYDIFLPRLKRSMATVFMTMFSRLSISNECSKKGESGQPKTVHLKQLPFCTASDRAMKR